MIIITDVSLCVLVLITPSMIINYVIYFQTDRWQYMIGKIKLFIDGPVHMNKTIFLISFSIIFNREICPWITIKIKLC